MGFHVLRVHTENEPLCTCSPFTPLFSIPHPSDPSVSHLDASALYT